MKRKFRLDTTLKLLAAILLISMPLTLSAQSKKDRQKAKKLVEQAEAAFGQKNYRQAADLYGQALFLFLITRTSITGKATHTLT
jgi:hypothetical protein